ncbi:TetR/AcrR family transcriptional regulator C-terminal domain-containing protein [Nonomuraea sp. CA-141351]|uniref:TetR/AcrR family transcriptional regulator C-terminal domain-containing protein n=1 Tax=Nonomuraea sp. CA-141351 TaxID=3239996 RepID=UPI003D8C1A3F
MTVTAAVERFLDSLTAATTRAGYAETLIRLTAATGPHHPVAALRPEHYAAVMDHWNTAAAATWNRHLSALSRERVLEAALADREGVAALSMRKLGKEVGVEAITLYYYVPNKDAALDGLVELVVSRVTVRPVGEWRAWAKAFAESFRVELLRHPALMPVVATRPVATPGGLRTVESAAAALKEAGFTPTQALHVINAVSTFVVGHVLAEAGPGSTDNPDLDLADYPVLAEAMAAGLGSPQDHRERFELALNALLDGLDRVRVGSANT